MKDVWNLYQAKANFSELVALAGKGQEFVVAKYGKPIAKIVPFVEKKKKIKLGTLKGEVKVLADLKATDKEIEQMVYGTI